MFAESGAYDCEFFYITLQGLGLRYKSLGFQGSGIRVQALGFGTQGFGLRVKVQAPKQV